MFAPGGRIDKYIYADVYVISPTIPVDKVMDNQIKLIKMLRLWLDKNGTEGLTYRTF